jgi:cbb3-type cytochrome oxidase subunit 3
MISPATIDWLADNGPLIVLPVFMVIFFAFGFWAYRPKNKANMENYANIPLKESPDGNK